MTTLTILPYKDINTRIASQSSIEEICPICFGEEVDTEFLGEEMVVYYDAEGYFVAALNYTAYHGEPFTKSNYEVEEVIVNVCGDRNLQDILKDLCAYITDKDNSTVSDFNFECNLDDGLPLLLQGFADFECYTPSDNTMCFTYNI